MMHLVLPMKPADGEALGARTVNRGGRSLPAVAAAAAVAAVAAVAVAVAVGAAVAVAATIAAAY